MTHTYVTLEVSRRTFDEVKALLTAAGYGHAFHEDLIDMHGLALKAVKPASAGRCDLCRKVVTTRDIVTNHFRCPTCIPF